MSRPKPHPQRDGPVELLTIPEVAARLKISRASVYGLIDAGRLGDVVDVGTGKGPRTRVRAEAVDDFIVARTIPARKSA